MWTCLCVCLCVIASMMHIRRQEIFTRCAIETSEKSLFRKIYSHRSLSFFIVALRRSNNIFTNPFFSMGYRNGQNAENGTKVYIYIYIFLFD